MQRHRMRTIAPTPPRALCAALLLILAGTTPAPAEHAYPRLALGTAWPQKWITEQNDPAFLARYQEIYTNAPAERVLEMKQLMRDRGYAEWADDVRVIQFLELLSVSRAEPEADGKLVAWVYDYARNNLGALLTVAVYHNLHDHGADWMLHDVLGDSICVWGNGSCGQQALNVSPWCPKGQWDGRVSKVVYGQVRTWDFGSTVGLSVVEWLCTVALQRIYLNNSTWRSAFDGLQIEDEANRSLACLFGYTSGGRHDLTPDPRRDGVGFDCGYTPYPEYWDATRSSVDSLLTHHLTAVRASGKIVRSNGHKLRWLFDPRFTLGEDSVYTRAMAGAKLEGYGDWGGWPYADSTHGYWFRVYQAMEEIYSHGGNDEREGWDVVTFQTQRRTDWTAERTEQWLRLNLGQCLMGDGCFDGASVVGDAFFYRYLGRSGQQWQRYAPATIPEEDFALGRAVGDFQEYRPVPNAKPLYFRHFERETGTQTYRYTVVVNIWPVELAGIPRRDAVWFYGHHTQFPLPHSLMVFDHWPSGLLMPAWSIVRFGSGGMDRTIRFELPEAGDVALNVFDVNGRKVRTLQDQRLERGPWEFVWDGDDDRGRRAGGGVYFWRLLAGDLHGQGKLLLLR